MNPPTRSGSRTTGLFVALLAAAAPGALAGLELAGLLFFLNPRVPFEAPVVLRAFTTEAARWALASTLLHLPWIWGRWSRARRALPWTLTAVLVAAAVSAWIHASVYSYYLPTGINRRLLKAAGGLSAAAVLAFYTALVRHWRPRSRRRGRWLLWLASLTAIVVILERREAYHVEFSTTPRRSTFESSARPHLALIGLPGATLDGILPLAEQGRLPFFSEILERGAWSHLEPLVPTRRLPSWASVHSGRLPHRHGIVSDHTYAVSFSEERLRLLPLGLGTPWSWFAARSNPVRSTDKEALLLWEMLTLLDRRAAIVGSPLADPLPPGVEIALPETFFAGLGPGRPEELADRARWFRTEDVDASFSVPFRDAPELLTALAEDQGRKQLSFFILEQFPGVDALFVHLPGLEIASKKEWGGFAAVQFEASSDPAAQAASQRLSHYYMEIDSYLSELWERLPSPRWLVVVSPYGTRNLPVWSRASSLVMGRTALGGRVGAGSEGVLLLLGEDDMVAATNLRSPTLVDLVPTLLYGLGLPIGRDFDGSVLTSAFGTSFLARQPLSFVPSYETLPPAPAKP